MTSLPSCLGVALQSRIVKSHIQLLHCTFKVSHSLPGLQQQRLGLISFADLRPLVMVRAMIFLLFGECFPRLGKEAAHFLSDLGEEAPSHGDAAKSAFVRPVQQELSCALLQRNRVFKRLDRTFEHLNRLRYSSDWLSRVKTLFRCNKSTG